MTIQFKNIQHSFPFQRTVIHKQRTFTIKNNRSKSFWKKRGGIVQGMSGSPILQNGKIVGAVTHVLVGDPTQGYGILAQRMLKVGESCLNR